jgi:hypothetical protein
VLDKQSFRKLLACLSSTLITPAATASIMEPVAAGASQETVSSVAVHVTELVVTS